MVKSTHDAVNKPRHYNDHPSGVECITITEHMTFNVGNAMKYLWRAGLKAPEPMIDAAATEIMMRGQTKHIEDLRKAAWYVNREIERLAIATSFGIDESLGRDATACVKVTKRADGTLDIQQIDIRDMKR